MARFQQAQKMALLVSKLMEKKEKEIENTALQVLFMWRFGSSKIDKNKNVFLRKFFVEEELSSPSLCMKRRDLGSLMDGNQEEWDRYFESCSILKFQLEWVLSKLNKGLAWSYRELKGMMKNSSLFDEFMLQLYEAESINVYTDECNETMVVIK